MSCKKNYSPPGKGQSIERKVLFELYTTKSFAGEQQLVTFKLRMSDGPNTIWDSTLAPMQLKDIPSLANKITIEKKVPGNSNAQLVTGFIYTIENVGISWYNEVFNAGEQNKTVSFDFK